MDSPLKHHFEPAERPDCLDVSPERLNAMTAAQLERELEAALEAMTEEEYDPAVIDAYLDALDQKAPIPDHPDAWATTMELNRNVVSRAAAPAAQGSQTDRRDVPEEYQTVQLELERRGLPLYYPKIPEDFVAEDPFLYIDPRTNCISFGTGYTKGDISISFGFDQFEHSPSTIYEKDDRAVELYECGGVTHYILGNLSSMTAAWINGPVEYCLAANLSSDEIKELIQSIYEE